MDSNLSCHRQKLTNLPFDHWSISINDKKTVSFMSNNYTQMHASENYHTYEPANTISWRHTETNILHIPIIYALPCVYTKELVLPYITRIRGLSEDITIFECTRRIRSASIRNAWTCRSYRCEHIGVIFLAQTSKNTPGKQTRDRIFACFSMFCLKKLKYALTCKSSQHAWHCKCYCHAFKRKM